MKIILYFNLLSTRHKRGVFVLNLCCMTLGSQAVSDREIDKQLDKNLYALKMASDYKFQGWKL